MRRRSGWLVHVSVLVLSLAAAPGAHAALVRANWRLEGYLGQAPPGVKVEARVVLRYNDKDYEFDLTKAQSTNPRIPGSRFVHDLKSHQNKLSLSGPRASMDPLVKAAPGEKLLITGYYRTGSDVMQETRVATAPPDSLPSTR